MGRSSNGGFVTGMLVGAAAGAALALLYTPRSGRKALELLKSRGVDLGHMSRDTVQGQRDRFGAAAAEAREAARRTKEDMLGRFESAKREGHSE